MNDNIILRLEGNADDLLMINETESMKCTRLIYLPDNYDLDEEVVDICVTSTNVRGQHPIFDQMKGKKVRMTVETIE
ncbi:MAG: hypothetical protein LUD72_10900 [Bacteroidales bacterium]|nr:hypothetical protein [Bacteroidales bacterium]